MTDPELTKQPADSENYYRSLIHNLHEDIIVIDSNYTITDMNNSFLATVGRSAEDVIGHNCYEVSHGYDNPCDQYGQECPLRKVFDTGLPNRCRHTHTAKDGAKVYVDVMTAPIKDSGGNITHVVEAVRDITDLMEAQAQQRASDRQYRSVVEDSPVLICRFAPGGVIEFVNDAYCRYFAKTAQELVGSDFLSLVPAGNRDAVTANISALTADSPVSSHEHQVIAEGGEIRWQRWTNRALFDEEGQVVAYQSFGEDVTERKKTETALENMGQRLELALQAGDIGVWDWDLVTDEVYFSPEWKAQIGYAEDELPNVYKEWESRLHPEDREQTLRALRAYRQGQTDKYAVEFRLRHKDGSYRWIFARGEMLLDDSGKPVRMNGCHLDITDRVRAEETLQEEKDFAEDLIATAQAIVLVLDTEGRIVRFNPYMETVSGYSLDEVRGKDWISTFLPRRDHKRIRKLLLRAVDDIPTRGNVNAIVTKDGRERRIEWYDKTLKDREGNIAGLLSIGHDITEREQTTRALRESEMMNRSLLEGSPVCTKIIDLDSKLQYMSAAGLKQLKIPDITPYLGQPYPPEFYPESTRASLAKGLELAKAGEISSVEASVHDTTGGKIWYHTTFAPAYDDNGQVKYVIASSVEITERKRAEGALLASQERFEQVAEHAQEWIWEIDADGLYTYASPVVEKILGYSPEEIVGKKHFYDLFHPEQRQEMKNAAFGTFARKKSFREFPNLNVHKNGREVWLSTSGVPLLDENGDLVGYRGVDTNITDRKQAADAIADLARFPSENPYPVLRILPDGTISHANPAAARLLADQGLSTDRQAPDDWRQCAETAMKSGTVVRKEFHYGHEIFAFHFSSIADSAYVNVYGVDITEKKDMEAQLRQAQKMEAIGQLAGGVAHDFRNQLTVIQGYASMLLRHPPDQEKNREYLEIIMDAVGRATAITNQLLVFSRRESLHTETVDLNESVKDLHKLIPQMIGEDVRLLTVTSPESCFANVDPGLFQQAIMNLVVNARHAMPGGGELTIEVGHTEVDRKALRGNPDAGGGPQAVVTVSDTGSGMDAKTLEKIFDPFFTTKEVGVGTGMGLAMVYGFVGQSGGFIQVDSKPGRGSTFRLHFPLLHHAEASTDSTPHPEIDPLPQGDETLLVVEDEKAVRHMVVEVLRECGYTVLEAGNANEALPLGEHYEGRIDLLVTDVIMPRMTGVDMSQRLRRVRPDMPVLFLSGYGDSEITRGTLKQPGTELLAKPIDNMALAQTVRRMLDRANSTRQKDR